jgi:nucleoside-diphosphate-sugar epimerase
VIREEASRGEIFNLTFGQGRELQTVANIVQEEFPGISVGHAPRNALVPERGTLDVSKAKSLLGYAPEFDVERGFRMYIEWYRNLFARFTPDELSHVGGQVNE